MIAHTNEHRILSVLEESVHTAMMKWIEAVEGRDLSNLPDVVWQDDDLVWVGSSESDWIRGYAGLVETLKAQNAALQEIRINVSEEIIHATPGEHYAWATNRWIFRANAGDQEVEFPLRCTWVLEKRNGEWRIAHFHKSIGMKV